MSDCDPLSEVLFGPTIVRTDDDKRKRREAALKNFKDFLRPILEKAVGKERYEEGVEFVFEALQNPVINKQVRDPILSLHFLPAAQSF